MTHYDVNYSGLSPNDAHNQAIKDIIDYMGEEKYNDLTQQFRAFELNLDAFRMYVSFAGIQGFPVERWYNEVYPFG